MSLSGKVVIVTGGSRGIGAAIAERVAQSGASVVIAYASNTAAADKVVQRIGADKALAVKVDVSTVEGNAHLVDEAVKKFGKIDAIVPSAGIMPMRNLAATTPEDFDRVFNLNVKGPYFLAQKAVPHMPRGGRIIFISTGINKSTAVPPPYLLYAASKGAIDQMTRVMAKDLASKGITTNAVAPGPTGTDLFFEGKSEEMLKGMAAQNPFNRFGEPEEIANVVEFLCSDASRWVDGQTIHVNGGIFV